MTELARFAAGLGFGLDPFQRQACAALEAGRGVLVAAPTGAGKTVVGEFAVHLALAAGRKAFYTTPIKALSNQKYAELCRRHGSDRVGLLTGDSSINSEAPVVVMTTEVLRNMMYAGSPTLRGLGYVVMDEVHYLADRFRGAVWEEVIIHLPEDVLVVSLSATVSNAEEFGDWLGEVRGDVAVVVSEDRPVPLWQHMMVGKTLFDLFVEARDGAELSDSPGAAVPTEVNPALRERIRAVERGYAADAAAHRDRHRGERPWERHAGRPGQGYPPGGAERGRRPAGPGPAGAPTRADVITALDRDGLLPAITFVFSRNGCDAAVGQLLARGIRLIGDDEGSRNRRYVEERIGALADEDLTVLGYWDFVDGIEHGFAAHHAGMLPTFREIVEELFTQGRIRAVFATETLALGINMPARTVVLEKLVKFNGDTHAELTPAEYTQLTGRAGRRGIDIEGHGVVLWSRGLDPLVVGGLASTRTYPLRSSFRPTYNMAVNLVAQVGRDRAREVLETSFAQFQADRSVVGQARAVRRGERQLAEMAADWHCELGDFGEYAGLRAALRDLEKGAAKARSAAVRAEAELSLERLRTGDVVRLSAGRRPGYAVVVAGNRSAPGRPAAPAVVTEDRQLRRLSTVDVPTPIRPLFQLRIPASFNPKSPQSRRDLAASLRIAVSREVPPRHTERGGPDEGRDETNAEIARLRGALRAHPCHACPDREEHARRAERWWRLRRETDALARQVEGRTNTVARTFDRICALLQERDYLTDDGTVLTPAGEDLRRIYTERDLLTAQCLREGVWNRLDYIGLAAVVSALVHEARREGLDTAPRLPSTDVAEAIAAMNGIWSTLHDQERRHGLPTSTAPDAGIVWMVHRWAAGQRLDAVLRGSDLAAGDFVRRCKQVIDLLDQIGDVAEHPALAAKARRAVEAVRRGVVAAERLD